MKHKKILALSLAAAMSFSLCGCAVELNLGGSRAKTAAEVIEKYAAAMEESQNYHVDMDMDFKIGAKGDGVTVELPITMGLSADVMDGNLHGDMQMGMNFMGESMEQKAEVYVVQERRSATTYMCDEENGYWTVSEDEENGAESAMSLSDMDVSAFEDADMVYDKEEKTYTVTQSLGDFADAGDTYELLSDVYSGMAEMMNMDPDDFMDEWEKASVIWVFDSDCRLLTMEIEDCEFSDTIKEDGMELDVTVSLALSYAFSDYGEITEKDVKVPDEVIDEAVPSLTLDLEDEDFNVDISTGEGDIDWDDEETYFEEPLDPGFTYDPKEEQGSESAAEDVPRTDGDQLGSLNGQAFTLNGDPWTMFANDGWVLSLDNDGEYTFAEASNGSYPDALLYVNDEDMEDVYAEDIRTYGIYGYTVDFLWCESAKRPAMTWNGITFGATVEDVKAAYGEPDYEYEGSMYMSYTYKVGEAEIDFYVTPDNGLQKVAVNVY